MQAIRSLVAIALTATSSLALAHSGHGDAGFLSGLAHPFSGADHLLAMLAVGLLAAQHTGLRRLALPAAFVFAMAAGALLGAAGWGLPMQEAGIATSLMVFGLMIAFALRAAFGLALPVVALFALFHGGAHFAEMGQGSLLQYVVGFMLASVALHGAGLLLARWQAEHRAARLLKRVAGGAIAATGMVLVGA
jgi:urease accessory protein